MACDFFAVETVRLEVLYVLFFLHVQTRRVFVAGCTAHPRAMWVGQQARNTAWDLADAGIRHTILLRDRDAKFPPAFDAAFATQGARVVRAPFRAPRANALAERWVGTIRRECLDWLLILGPRHLERVLREDVRHYNHVRPHRALQLRAPLRAGNPSLRWARSAVTIGSAACCMSILAAPPDAVFVSHRPNRLRRWRGSAPSPMRAARAALTATRPAAG